MDGHKMLVQVNLSLSTPGYDMSKLILEDWMKRAGGLVYQRGRGWYLSSRSAFRILAW